MFMHFDTLDAQETLTRMQIQIRDLGHEIMPEQLTAWQVEDMNRKFPNTETPDYVTAETKIWPRSRIYERTHQHRVAREARFRRPRSSMPRLVNNYGKSTGTSHPILRVKLYEMLISRMAEVMSVNLKWVTSSTVGAQAPVSEHK